MKKILIITRHGNTFLPGETPRRVGRGTDLPLVEEKRGRAIGKYLKTEGYVLDRVYAAPLKRTMLTAQLTIDEMEIDLKVVPENRFSEIDYGPDENKTEEEVKIRLGKHYALKYNLLNLNNKELLNRGEAVIEEWDRAAVAPYGWLVDVDAIISSWQQFSNSLPDGSTTLLCSSNGIIRFAPHLLDMPYDDFCTNYDIKVATGSVSIFEHIDGTWTCKEWNTKPYAIF